MNGREVTPLERSNARSVLKSAETLMMQAFSHDCHIHQLRKAINIISLHDELRSVVFGKMEPYFICE